MTPWQRIGTVGLIGCVFGKISFLAEAAEHFVRADVVEEGKALTLRSGSLKEIERSDNVRVNEVGRSLDGAVHMGLCSEVADAVYVVTGENRRHVLEVAYVRSMKNVAIWKKGGHICEVLWVAGIGQLINIDDPPVKIRLMQKIADEIAADKPASSRYQKIIENSFFHGFSLSKNIRTFIMLQGWNKFVKLTSVSE